MGLSKRLFEKLKANLTHDEYLLGQTKALLLQAMFIMDEDRENIFVFDGPDSLMLFIEAAKVFVASERQVFRFQFIVKSGARAHDLAGDMRLLEADSLDYAVILDANLDNAFLNYLVEKIDKSFSKIKTGVISNFQPSSEWPYLCQQRYGYTCSVFAVDNVVQFSANSSKEISSWFMEKSRLVDEEASSAIRALDSLPVNFARLAHKPTSFFPLESEELSLFPHSEQVDRYYAGIQYDAALSYSHGFQLFNTQINVLKKKYAELLLNQPNGFLCALNQSDYNEILKRRFGFLFITSYMPIVPLSSRFSLRNEGDFLSVELLSSASIRSYRLGDIKRFYEFLEFIENTPDVAEADKQVQIEWLRSHLFAIQAGDFLSNPFLGNARTADGIEPKEDFSIMELVTARQLVVQPLFNFPAGVSLNCHYKPPRVKPLSRMIGDKNVFFETYSRIHAENPVDPCPDAVTITGKEKVVCQLFLDIYRLLDENPGWIETLGGENTLLLLGLVWRIHDELDTRAGMLKAASIIFSPPCFFSRLNRDYLIQNRYNSASLQRAYDKKYGLLVQEKPAIIIEPPYCH